MKSDSSSEAELAQESGHFINHLFQKDLCAYYVHSTWSPRSARASDLIREMWAVLNNDKLLNNEALQEAGSRNRWQSNGETDGPGWSGEKKEGPWEKEMPKLGLGSGSICWMPKSRASVYSHNT